MATSLGNAEFYSLDKPRLGTCFVINNLDTEQIATRHDVDRITKIIKTIGFDVEIHKDLTKKQMKELEKRMFDEDEHKDASIAALFIISHGTLVKGESFIMSTDSKKAWSVDNLVDKYSAVSTLHGKPKLIFIEACRGSTRDGGVLPDKTSPSAAVGDTSNSTGTAVNVMHVKQPSKQDVFIGFATSPGFVSWTPGDGSPYVKYLAEELTNGYETLILADIHRRTRSRLAEAQIGQYKQGAEERTTLLKKLAFYRYKSTRTGKIYDYSCKPQAIFIGNAYDIFKDTIEEARILQSSPTDKETPEYVKVSRVKQEKSIMKLFTSHEEYVNFRLQAMSVTETPNHLLFTPKTKPGLNVVQPVTNKSRTFLTHVKQDIRFEISLKENELKMGNLDSHFINDVQKLPYHDQEHNTEAFLENREIQAFVAKYQLYFVESAKSGGSLITKMITKKKDLSQEKVQEFKREIEDTKSRSLLSRPSGGLFSRFSKAKDQEVEAKFSVGDNSVMAENFEKMSLDKKDYIDNLISSSPAPLTSEVVLLPTHVAASLVDPDKGKMLQRWTELAINRGVGWRTITYDNGNTYTGQVVSGRPHGHGEEVWQDGHRYHGEWREGVKEGFGEYRCSCGQVQAEQYKSGKLNGEAVEMFSDGRIYEGLFKQDLRHGWGTSYYSDGSRWEGEYADNKENGRGTLTQADGSKIEGTWKDGKKI